MTREEAIYKLEQTKRYSKYLSDDEIAAVVLAIKALEQEPCDDCISREEAKEKLKAHREFFLNSYGGFSQMPKEEKVRVDEIDNCVAEIMNLPSVTPQPKTGRWKFTVYDANHIGHYECTECHWNVLMNVSDYCPHCGARMEVEE